MKTNHTPRTNSNETFTSHTVWSFYSVIAPIVILLSLVAALPMEAAPGDLDPRFGNGGVAFTDFSQTTELAYSIAVQEDGKIVACGQSGVSPNLHSALARYSRNGRLDASFGTAGKVVVRDRKSVV